MKFAAITPTTMNLITHFAKVNHVYFCMVAHESRDIKNFCRHLFFYVMDRKGRVRFDQPIVTVIHALTGWEKPSIRKAIAFLVKSGEMMRITDDDNGLIVNDLIANKQGLLVPFMPYNGKNPEYHLARLTLAEGIQKLANHTEERSMYVANQLREMRKELETVKLENTTLRLENAELRGEMRGSLREFERGIEKGFHLRYSPIEDKESILTPPSSPKALIKESNVITMAERKYETKH